MCRPSLCLACARFLIPILFRIDAVACVSRTYKDASLMLNPIPQSGFHLHAIQRGGKDKSSLSKAQTLPRVPISLLTSVILRHARYFDVCSLKVGEFGTPLMAILAVDIWIPDEMDEARQIEFSMHGVFQGRIAFAVRLPQVGRRVGFVLARQSFILGLHA